MFCSPGEEGPMHLSAVSEAFPEELTVELSCQRWAGDTKCGKWGEPHLEVLSVGQPALLGTQVALEEVRQSGQGARARSPGDLHAFGKNGGFVPKVVKSH